MPCSENALRVTLTIGVLIVFTFSAVLTYFAQVGGSDIFLDTTTGIFNRFPTDLNQAPWLIFWAVIVFAWQGLWIIYSLSLLCRVGPHGPRYSTPTLLSPAFLGLFILGLLLYMSWCLLLDRETFELAFVFTLGATMCFYSSLAFAHNALYEGRFELAKQDRRFDDILIRVLVLNGIAALATYLLNITIQTMAIVIAYRSNPPIDPITASTIALAFYALILLTIGVLDIVVNDKYTRYTFSTYVNNIIILTAMLDDGSARINTIIISNALGFDISTFVTKIALIFGRNKTTPIFPRKSE